MSNSKPRRRAWTIVQHSAYGYSGKRQFARGLEIRRLGGHGEPPSVELARVNRAGGVVLTSYAAAVEFGEAEAYPAGCGDLIPQARGHFSDKTVDGLRIYVPPATGVA
jgi:hypothetical protein